MEGNFLAVQAVPGRCLWRNLCRHCHNEVETLAYVVRSYTTPQYQKNNNLKNNKFEVYKEVLITDVV